MCSQCRIQVEGRLNPETDQVICLECGEQINTVTDFTKASMRRSRDFVQESRRAFAFHHVDCPDKKAACSAKLSADGKTVVCAKCEKVFEVTEYMKRVMKNLREQDDRSQTTIPKQ
jgi:Fe2+ or Zn2+ uptake regulation protein